MPPPMVVDVWFIAGLVGLFLCGAGSGYVGARVGLSELRRRTVSLESDLALLEERQLREIKTRASALGVKAKKEDEEILSKLAATPAKPPAPWWAQYVNPDLKGS